ncbi:MAG: TetR/AcrR family transcriptional regulator [Chloroflexi bacterium]|nr:TetR/AcrR family transcriptional regulator [Chloroflexota bacterium]
MNQRKPDRRVQRTRRQLQESLTSLILAKGYDAVTIEDITEQANLGRTTFYLHYKDKEELLMQSLEAVFDDLVAQIQQRSIDDWVAHGQGPWTLAFEHAAENARFYQIILSGQGGDGIKRRVQNYIAATAKTTITRRAEELGASLSLPIEVLSNYIASSLLGLIAWWLESEQTYTVAQMDDFFRQLTMHGTARAIGFVPLTGGGD